MFFYLDELTVRFEDIVKVVPSKNSIGTYLYVRNNADNGNPIDREYTKHAYESVVSALKVAESHWKQK